jgi:putative flippase GtrA
MLQVVQRAVDWLHTPRGRKLFRYLMGSVISTAVSFVVLTLVYGVLHLWSPVPSAVFANGVATVPSYYLNRNWTWGKRGRSKVWREMLPFWATSATGIALSMLSEAYAHQLSDGHHLHRLASTVLVDGANLVTFVVLWVAKFLVFNKLFKVTPAQRLDDELAAVA